MTRIRGWLANLLCVIGLSGMLGYATGFFPLTLLAQHYNVAPIPSVFTVSNTHETIARRFSVTIETASGNTHVFGEDGSGFAHGISGPFSRRASYIAQAAFPEIHLPRQTTAILYYGFCVGTLAQELGVAGRVKKIDVRAWSAIEAEDFDRSFTVECYR